MIWFYPDNIESGDKCGLRNIKIRNSPSEWHEFFLFFRLQIEVRTSFFVWQKFFRTFIKIRNIEICNI